MKESLLLFLSMTSFLSASSCLDCCRWILCGNTPRQSAHKAYGVLADQAQDRSSAIPESLDAPPEQATPIVQAQAQHAPTPESLDAPPPQVTPIAQAQDESAPIKIPRLELGTPLKPTNMVSPKHVDSSDDEDEDNFKTNILDVMHNGQDALLEALDKTYAEDKMKYFDGIMTPLDCFGHNILHYACALGYHKVVDKIIKQYDKANLLKHNNKPGISIFDIAFFEKNRKNDSNSREIFDLLSPILASTNLSGTIPHNPHSLS